MLQSRPIQVDGHFVGGAVLTDRGYRFIATDMRLEPIDQSTWPALSDLERVARHLLLTGRLPERPRIRLVASRSRKEPDDE